MKQLATLRAHYALISLFIACGAAFIWLSLIGPDNRPVIIASKLTHTQVIIVLLAVVLPYVGIWLTGLLGYLRLKDYVGVVRKTLEGKSLARMTNGIFGLLISLPVMSLVSSAAQVIQDQHPTEALWLRRIGTYLVIAILLWAFYALRQSTHAMLVELGRPHRYLPRVAALIFMFLGGLYIYFVLTNSLFENGSVKGHLPPWVVIDTVVLPRLLAWFWGLHAVWNMYQYAKVLPGRIYRLAFNYLAVGVGVVTITIILLQYLQAISAVAKLNIGIILLLIYVILVLASAGFMLVARGGKELLKIEEV
jgi:hypothetical protein